MKKGFTLIELLVVVLIIGILVAIALPNYGRAAERTRLTEALELLNSISHAERRKQMQTSKYMTDYGTLDVSPKGAVGSVYYTRGNPVTGENCNGFEITLGANGNDGQIEAVRYAPNRSLEFQYSLRRWYDHDNTTCVGQNYAGKALCADVCGIETAVEECCMDGTIGACQN